MGVSASGLAGGRCALAAIPKDCDTVTDGYLSAAQWSQRPRWSLSSHERTACVNAIPSDVVVLERCYMSAIIRSMTLSVASVATIGLVVAIGPAPLANATPCSAPEANVDPPAAPPAMPAPQPVVQPPTGRRPSHTNDRAPLPKLGPLISSFLKPTLSSQRYAAPVQPQAGVAPPAPNPPTPGIAQSPNATQLSPNAAAVPPRSRHRRRRPRCRSRAHRHRWSTG